MSSWINDKGERRQLAKILHTKYHDNRRRQENITSDAELKNIDTAWKNACETAEANGEIRLCWLDLGQISHRVYTFEVDYCQKLEKLVLDGIGLSSIGDIADCGNLKHLSMASNRIKDISSIHGLCKLSSLNLLRNDLTHLPTGIGDLVALTRLDLANNKLIELPPEIGDLIRLNYLNLECNELSELPHNFGKLRCDIVILNYNQFAVFPASVLSIPNLKQLSMNGNKIGSLPSEMGRHIVLEVLHLSKNRINVLPDSLVEIGSLRCIWLDYNKLSSLPPNFHRLTMLKEIKMEGNIDMVYPPLVKVAMGAEEVLRWSRNRGELNKSSKVRHIVQSVEEVLNQVKKYRIGGLLHETVFEVVGEYFQFPPDAFWSIFIPELSKMWSDDTTKASDYGITSFPFERHDVEQALFEFRDAAGPIVRKNPNGLFRRCACSKVCVPPKLGFMCEKPALLVRTKVAYEENMREKRRVLAEEKRISDAIQAVSTVAEHYLNSEEGRLMVREEAERIFAMKSEKERTPKTSKNSMRTMPLKSTNEGMLSSIYSSTKRSVANVASRQVYYPISCKAHFYTDLAHPTSCISLCEQGFVVTKRWF